MVQALAHNLKQKPLTTGRNNVMNNNLVGVLNLSDDAIKHCNETILTSARFHTTSQSAVGVVDRFGSSTLLPCDFNEYH